MTIELINRSVTIVAQQFNPSIFGQLWLVRRELMAAEEFDQSSVFSQNLVQVIGKRFNLLVFPQQLQLSPSVDQAAEGDLIPQTISKIAGLLPETPYTAIGMNFIWQMLPANESIRRFSRRLFGRTDSPLYQQFCAEDALFGAHMSKDFLGWRMNLDVRPTGTPGSDEERLQLAFNYHLDLTASQNASATIAKDIMAWNAAKSESRQIVELLRADS
jgi:hypothetical protein